MDPSNSWGQRRETSCAAAGLRGDASEFRDLSFTKVRLRGLPSPFQALGVPADRARLRSGDRTCQTQRPRSCPDSCQEPVSDLAWDEVVRPTSAGRICCAHGTRGPAHRRAFTTGASQQSGLLEQEDRFGKFNLEIRAENTLHKRLCSAADLQP